MGELKREIKQFLKKIRIGRRGSTARRAARQLLKGFERFGIDLVFDVGANTGQFATQIRSAGFKGHIVSFEPLSDAHAKLRLAAARDALWTVHERSAVGDRNGDIEINIAGNSVSSSVLPMAAAHANAAPVAAYVGRERVPLTTMDSIIGGYVSLGRRPFLKIDTQGYEWQVLSGTANTLPLIQGVLCELSLVELYEGQVLWREMIDWLEQQGFTLWALQPSFMDQHGRNLQTDAIFFRA